MINPILDELRALKKWKEEFEKKKEREQKNAGIFELDESNPHFKKFIQTGRNIKKISGGFWDVAMNKMPIDKGKISKFTIRQIKAGKNGSFMFGIGTSHIKGMNRAQDSKYFIGYYELTGFVY